MTSINIKRERFEKLKKASTKLDLAECLHLRLNDLTYSVYGLPSSVKYRQLSDIKKSNGVIRKILAPVKSLKFIQSRLSELLQDCIDVINDDKSNSYKLGPSHGFKRKHSIATNAAQHLNKKHVFNIDLENFFDDFNFGRVRGFFIKNRNFQLNQSVATTIAQIACYNNKLPQGSPCSPVITNLITHSLDISLVQLAKSNSCFYSRYADDITFSTRKKSLPNALVKVDSGLIEIGEDLASEIHRAGFKINKSKTRIQYNDSRQEVTGLVVNKRVNIKQEYWRLVRNQCKRLFDTGDFFEKTPNGTKRGCQNTLYGKLRFINFIESFEDERRQRCKEQQSAKSKAMCNFFFYETFYSNSAPIVVCEGITDPIHLKCAAENLSKKFINPLPKIRFIYFSEERIKLLRNMNVSGAGESGLVTFANTYKKQFAFYKAKTTSKPVIIFLDADKGSTGMLNSLKKKELEIGGKNGRFCVDKIKKAEFVHVVKNLYVVFIPFDQGKEIAIEGLHSVKTRGMSFNGRIYKGKPDKVWFATDVVKANKKNISFDGFEESLRRIDSVISHFNEHSQRLLDN